MIGKTVLRGLAARLKNWVAPASKPKTPEQSQELSEPSAAPSPFRKLLDDSTFRTSLAQAKAAGLTQKEAAPTGLSFTTTTRNSTAITIQIRHTDSTTHTISFESTALEDSTALTAIYRLLTKYLPGKWPALQPGSPNSPKLTSPLSDFEISQPGLRIPPGPSHQSQVELNKRLLDSPAKSPRARLLRRISKTRDASSASTAKKSSQSAKRSSRGKACTGSKTTAR